MHLSYKTLAHPREKKFERSGTHCTIFEKDDFKSYVKALEDNNKYVHIVARTALREIDSKDDEDTDEDWVEIPDENGELKKFKIYNKRHRLRTVGYLPLSEMEFIQIESGLPFLILLIPITLAIVAAVWLNFNPSGIPPIEEDDMEDWDGNSHMNGENSDASTESTTIPGFANITVNKSSPSVQLYNPPENTVRFVYTITEQTSKKVLKTFDTSADAMSYVSEHEPKYKNDYSSEGRYQLIDLKTNKAIDTYVEYTVKESVNHKFTVTKTKSKVIYFTKEIKPGKAVNWNATEQLEPGTHDLEFRISAYDVDTDMQCYGVVLDVKAVIE